MKNYSLLFIFIIALGTICAQERSSFFNKKFEHFTVDVLENFYGWEGNILDKYSPDGKLVATYSNKSWGNITRVDASIPSKILVFYQESGTILFLDSKLSPAGNCINLFDKGLFSISTAAILSSNSIALFDLTSQNLYISDFDLNVKLTTPCNFGEEFVPVISNTLLDKEILLVNKSGLYFFDKFGSFEKQLPITDIISSQLNKNTLFYLRHDRIHKYDLQTLSMEIFPLEKEDIKEFYISSNYIFILDISGEIFKYSTKK